MQFRSANLASLLAATARRLPDAPGLIRGERFWTWSAIGAAVGALAAGLRDRFGLGPGDRLLVQYSGLGEVTGCITGLRPEDHGRPEHEGSCGIPRSGMQMEVQGPEREALPPGAKGELCVAVGAVFAGYWQDPEAIARAIRNAWLLIGDLGHVDPRGYLHLAGIAEACVFGMPDAKWGESGVAVLVAADGRALDLAGVAAALATRIARYKIPKPFEKWEALPRSGHGTITKKDVRAAYLARLGAVR